MGKVDVPPRYVVAPASLVFADLPRAIVLTGIRVWALGWRHNYEYTGPVTEEDLLELLGMRRRQLFEHLKRLVGIGVLRYTYINARFTFDFTASRSLSRGPPRRGYPWGPALRKGSLRSAENCTGPDMSVVDDDLKVSTDSNRKQQQQNGRAREILQALGVMDPTRSELLRLRWVTEGYLENWVVWFREQDRLGLGFVIEQWRKGEEAPETNAEREKRVRQEAYARYNIQT